MTVTYENTTDDAIAVNVHRISKAMESLQKKKRLLNVVRVILAALTGLLVALSLAMGRLPFSTLIYLVMSVFIIFFTGFITSPRFYKSLFLIQRKELTRNGAFRGDTGLRQVSVQPEGLVIIQPGVTELLLRWNAVEQVEVGETHLFVTWAAQQALAIPRRAFADVGQEQTFLSLIEQYRIRAALAAPVALPATVDAASTLGQNRETPWYRSRDGVDTETTVPVTRTLR